MMIDTKPLPADAKGRMLLSYVGYLGIIGAFVAPKETYLSVKYAIRFMKIVYAGFCALFFFLPDQFYSDNFAKPPKDNFGRLFMVMFGYLGFAVIYLIHLAKDNPGTFPALCVFNAGLCYVGPQRGEILNAPNVLAKHVVPHAGLLSVSIALLATLL
mmetsp:Transcript_7457/g.17172  ORF Transcript_7457/g.17172 Transcript_7457/m.17172 type:complete len:157 (+) Transcript_7457:260-730(+)